MTVRKCPHGVKVGPLDDYNVPEDEPVKSTYCNICTPTEIEYQYLSEEQKKEYMKDASSD